MNRDCCKTCFTKPLILISMHNLVHLEISDGERPVYAVILQRNLKPYILKLPTILRSPPKLTYIFIQGSWLRNSKN
jgi:hypothetical protein